MLGCGNVNKRVGASVTTRVKYVCPRHFLSEVISIVDILDTIFDRFSPEINTAA